MITVLVVCLGVSLVRQLELLDLSGTRVSADSAADFQKSAPNLWVERLH